jgi:serine/threonine protein kinase
MGEREFGPYRLVQQIAVGGMAEIHLAKTSGIAGFEKYVALKMIHPNFSQDEQFIQMLIDEAKITVQLQHVNVAQTFDLGRVGDTYYITMEYVDGADLYKLLRRASERDIPMPVDVAAYIGKEIATGLDYAHRKRDVSGRPLRIVHRDVSPQNVLISHAGEVKLVDFGIAKATMRVRQTAVGVIKGKYYYMSPEQAWGDPLDHRSDIFSAGIVLYEMLTGQMLYLEEDLHRLLDMVRKANIAPPTTLRRDIPPQLERIVMHALSKRAEDRYQTAGDFATDLERFLHVYSPVFTATKVTSFFDKVLVEDEPPAAPAVVEAPRDPGLSTARVSRDKLVRARSEFTDENSVIFRINDLQRPSTGSWGDDMTAPDPMPERVAAGPASAPRSPNMATMEIAGGDLGDDGDDYDEKTVISGPPGFGGEPEPPRRPGTSRPSDPTFAADPDPTFEPTMIETGELRGDFDEGPTLDHSRRRGRIETPPPIDDDGDEGPTRLDVKPAERRASRRSVSNGIPKPTLGKKSELPAHPALSAKTRPPAVSAIRQPRQSRRTPARGVPSVGDGGGSSSSLLSAIVESSSEPGPTAQLRGGSGVPRSIIPPEQQDRPRRPPTEHPLPTRGPDSSAPTAPTQRPPNVDRARTGFPLNAPRTPNPVRGFPIQDQPGMVSAFPTGQPPTSLTKQLAALELDEIPPAYKIGRSRSGARWLLVGAVGATVIALGVVVVLLLSGGDDAAATARVRIDTLPDGATIEVNGEPLPQVSPAFLDDVEPGKRYRIVASKPGYEPKEKELLVEDDTDVLLFLDKIPHRLVITSRPKADLFVDNVRVGSTPHDRKYQVAPEVVELRLKGYKPERRVLEWGDETEKTLEITLTKK